MKNLTTFNQLEVQFQIVDFAKKTIHQINKDLNGLFEGSIISFPQEEKRMLDVLIKELVPILKSLNEYNNLQQFMYQIDLNEQVWLSFLKVQDYEELGKEIIIREAQKVYLRELFKAQ